MRAPLTPLTLIIVAIATAPAIAACPTSTYLYGGLDPATPIVEYAPANDTTFRVQPCETMHGRYQLNAGLLLASTSGCAVGSSFPAVTGLETIVEDDFTVTGLPAGTPVGFDAVLELDGEAFSSGEPGGGGGGRVRGLIYETLTNQVSLQQGTTGQLSSITVHQPLTLHVDALAGTPVRLRFAVRGECLDGVARMEGTFHFANLPPGAFVQSCRGYTSAAPVPARPSTWGRLKTSHR